MLLQLLFDIITNSKVALKATFIFSCITHNMSIADKIETLIAPLLEKEKMELVDIQYAHEGGRNVLRVFLDKEGGIMLGDCERMSREIGDIADNSGIISQAYVLEISSPGIDRVLKKEKDFVRFTGCRAHISLFAPIDGQRNFIGKIVSAGNGSLTVSDNSTNKTLTISLAAIARARLEPEIDGL